MKWTSSLKDTNKKLIQGFSQGKLQVQITSLMNSTICLHKFYGNSSRKQEKKNFPVQFIRLALS